MAADSRNPKASSAVVAKVMRANRASRTGPERDLAAALRAQGASGYRLNWKGAAGRPDVAYPGRRIAVFVHGCYWHRCPTCRLPLPKANREFWRTKFIRNRARDRRKRRELERDGWNVVEVWECWIRDNPGKVPSELRRRLKRSKRPARM